MEVDSGSILDRLGPARRYADPEGSLDGRLLAARGALPLAPPQIAQVLFALTLDPDPGVKERARQSLESLPDPIVEATLSADVHPALLHWLAERFREKGACVERIALNSAAADETLCLLATLPYPRVVDILANNQTRLLRCPALLDALGENSLTGQSTIDRILQFLNVERGIPGAAGASRGSQAAEQLVRSDPPEAAAAPDLADLPPELLEESQAPATEAEEDERSRNLWSLIQDMSVVQKIKLAHFGNGEARGLLVRDRNKLVATAAIRSPKITEAEVTGFVKSRSVCDEVIRLIANSREWTRSYAIQLALCSNPKTPVQSAIKFLNYLTDRDLTQLVRSRDVPGPISVQARRILSRKGK